MSIFLLITLVSLTLLYTFYMGFNDGASAVATTITTRAMKPSVAITLAALSKFITPLILYFFINNLAVANTVKGLISETSLSGSNIEVTQYFLLAGLIATLLWCFLAYYRQLPNSGSHTLMGGIVGAGIAAFGFNSISWNTVFFKVLLMAILAPVIGLIIGYGFMKLFRKLAKSASIRINFFIRNLQKLNVILLASSFSLNNVQKSLGVLLLIMSVGNLDNITGNGHDLFFMLLICAIMLTGGMFFGGYRIINTVGNKIFKIKPFHSVVAQVSTGAIIYVSSVFGIPVSTGQVVSSSIMGVGASERLSGVQWVTAKKIFISWFITFPISAALGALFYYLITFIKGVI